MLRVTAQAVMEDLEVLEDNARVADNRAAQTSSSPGWPASPLLASHYPDVVSVRLDGGGCFGLALLRFGQGHGAVRRAAGG